MPLDLPSFIATLRQREQMLHADAVRFISCHTTDVEAKRMVDLIERETTRQLRSGTLRSGTLDVAEHNELDAFDGLRREAAAKFVEDHPGETHNKFETIFCNEAIIIPDCLVRALDQNKEFRSAAASLRKSIEETIYEEYTMKKHELDYLSEDEMEAILRAFPGLSDTNLDEELATFYSTIRFLPLMVRLEVEYGRNVRDRMGYILNWVTSPGNRTLHDDDVLEFCDECQPINYTGMLDEFRSMDLFFKEDIQRFHLVDYLLDGFDCTNCDGEFFAEMRFRYLIDWDPQSLTTEDHRRHDGELALHRSVTNFEEFGVFPIVLELGLKHFPTKLGFLFRMNNDGLTPYAMACEKYGKEKVTNIVESLLFANDGVTTQSKSLGSMLISLATDRTVHVEAIYTVLQRDQSILAGVSPKAGRNGKQKRKRSIKKRHRRKKKRHM